jgi:hypothetical protein
MNKAENHNNAYKNSPFLDNFIFDILLIIELLDASIKAFYQKSDSFDKQIVNVAISANFHKSCCREKYFLKAII